ncbi:MAG: hypothetical protein HY934_04185 [Candidatus Firestonebacteria bacterium]|nr:hypothetical protein [Candidatus Firestonebacteria bacterium]
MKCIIKKNGFEKETVLNIILEKDKTVELNISLNYIEVTSDKIVIKPISGTVVNEPKSSFFKLKSEDIRNQTGAFQDPVRTLTTLPGVVSDGDLNSIYGRIVY